MSDLIRREDAYAAIRGLTRHIDRIAAITALPAVQPTRITCGLIVCECGMTGPCKAPFEISRLGAEFEAAIFSDVESLYEDGEPTVKPFDCECGQVGPCKAQFCTPRSAQPHVNETPKSEHEVGNVLTPATKGGA